MLQRYRKGPLKSTCQLPVLHQTGIATRIAKGGPTSAANLEARGGIEPPIKVLQTFALPLGDRASDASILPDRKADITSYQCGKVILGLQAGSELRPSFQGFFRPFRL